LSERYRIPRADLIPQYLIGHTPNFNQIVSRCNSEVIIIDTGISKAYGGVLSALEIIYDLYETSEVSYRKQDRQDVFAEINAKRKTEFVEVEVVNALYTRGKVQLDRREGVVAFDTSRPTIMS
jgi:hypothetical protein